MQRSALSFAGERARRPFPTSSRQRVPGRTHDAQAPCDARHSVEGAETPERRRRLRTADRHGMRQEVSEPIGLGRSSHRERSRWEELDGDTPTEVATSPWPVNSRLAQSHPQLGDATERCRPPRAKLHQRATADVVLRSSDGRGRARGSYRLQKSTDGAWPPTPMCEERVETLEGLARRRESDDE